jgi:hypothetical protein
MGATSTKMFAVYVYSSNGTVTAATLSASLYDDPAAPVQLHPANLRSNIGSEHERYRFGVRYSSKLGEQRRLLCEATRKRKLAVRIISRF